VTVWLQDFIYHTYVRMRKNIILILGLLISTVASFSQDSGALIEALIRKGVLTNQEAEDIRADLVIENNTIPSKAIAGGKSTDRLSIGMRMQLQYASLDTDLPIGKIQPSYTDQAFTRRIYFTLKAGVGGNWGATMTYDFAGGSYDDAIIEYKPTSDLSFNFGLRKVNNAYEERATSGNLRSIERSGITRYFVETNNGRRLGAASYRIGAFVDGKKELNNKLNLIYGAAITNPQRDETFSGAASSGTSTNNSKALWANMGFVYKLPENGSVLIGLSGAYLPDQGGFSNTNLGKGNNLRLYSVHADATYKKFTLLTEYLTANIDKGASLTKDSSPRGWFIQPTFYLTDDIELVARYQTLNTDYRGVNLGDVVRSAPVGGTMNKFDEYYFGGNLYIRGNDLKFQLGVLSAKTYETLQGQSDSAKVLGARSQLQIQF
jgi:hypothetical protein